jgi:hypothetical protein
MTTTATDRQPTTRAALRWIGPLLLAAALTGCGSGSPEGERCGPDLVVAMTAGLSCLGTVTTSSPPPPPASAPPPASEPPPEPEPGNTVVMNRVAEYEPNSTFDNANPVSFKAAAPGDNIGIEITGSVERESDAADFFILTPPRTDMYAIYLCADSCTEQPVTDEVYIAVYDQGQTTIASTPVGTSAKQQLAVELAAGLTYYVEINGYDTVFEYDYRLVIID